jgi:hypothetical protein
MATKTVVKYRKAKAKHRAHAKTTIPLAVMAGFLPLGLQALTGFKEGGIHRAGVRVTSALTGYDPDVNRWDAAYLRNGLLPIGLGFGVHWIASRVGLNRALGRAGIPLLRI